jgi:hypothetical protein
VQGEQQEQAQHQGGRDDQLRAGTRVLMVNVLSRCATGRAPTFDYWPGAVRADQVFTTHGTPSGWPAPRHLP